jgi:Type III flagellar switch regulator (C-ring) FliN C-term
MTDRAGTSRYGARWRPRSHQPQPQGAVADPAANALFEFAQMVVGRVPLVLREARQASQSSVRRHSYEENPGCEDRAWRFTVQSREAFCVLGDTAERGLLRLIVGAAPRHRLSAIERRITTEAVNRLLAPSGEPGTLAEVTRERPCAPTWHCSVAVSGSDESGATLEFFIPCSPPAVQLARRPNIEGVVLPLRAVLSGACDLASVMQWRPGSLVRLQWGLEVSPMVFAGGRRIAQGQLGSLRGDRALMLTAVWTRA